MATVQNVSDTVSNASSNLSSVNASVAEGVNQSVNATAAAAQDPGAITSLGNAVAGLWGLLTSPPLLIFYALGLIGYAYYKGKIAGGKEKSHEYDATSLSERVDNKIINPALKTGETLNKPLYYGNNSVTKHKMGRLEKLDKTSEKISDSDYYRGDKDEEDTEQVDYLVMIVENTGFFSWVASLFHSSNPRENPYKMVIEAPAKMKDTQVLHDEGDHMVLKGIDLEEVDNVPGLFRASDMKTFEHVKERVTSSAMEDTLQTFSNISENLQALNIKNTEELAFFDKKMDIISDYKEGQGEAEQRDSSS